MSPQKSLIEKLTPRALIGMIMGSLNDLEVRELLALPHLDDGIHCQISVWKSAECVTLRVHRRTKKVTTVTGSSGHVRTLPEEEVVALAFPVGPMQAIQVLWPENEPLYCD